MSILYSNPSDLHDIVSGTSTGSPFYSAGPGYDYVTGVGSPIANLVVGSFDGFSTAPSDKLVLSAPNAETAGTSFSLTVSAQATGGAADTGYLGTIHFSSSDVQAGLPANYTFTPSDSGSHTFTVTLNTAGSQSITATDTASIATTGSVSGIVVSPAAASKFLLSGLALSTTAGLSQSVTVTAQDPYGNVATTYTGTVQFTSSDPLAVLPANYGFTVGDGGVHTFTFTFNTGGTQSLTVTDVSSGATGTQSGIVVAPAAPTNLAAVAASASQINLTWTGVAGASGYLIQESLSSTSGWTQTGSTNGNVTSFQQTGLAAGMTYYFRVVSTAGIIQSAPSNVAGTATTGTIATVDTLWSNSFVPTENSHGSGSEELGVKFKSSAGGVVTGVRFYKLANMNSNTQIGHLWSSTGTLLATAKFTNESASGWQQVNFSSPVAIQANTVYVVSFSTGGGYYGMTTNYFKTSGFTNGPLQALSNAGSGGDGVSGRSGAFPNGGGNGTNYWVDLAFTPSVSGTTNKVVTTKALPSTALGTSDDGGSLVAHSSAMPAPAPSTAPSVVSIATTYFRGAALQARNRASWFLKSSLAPGSLDG